MPLSPGTRLGPYEILTLIGAGGMGEVYKARDTRLERSVAIKVSSENYSARFEREARAVAAFNHPHICQLYDVGPNYLVMEYLKGETLADRLRRDSISFEEALRLAGELSEALDQAHRLGIVHRDLKPGNIMLVKSGSRASAKLLDFGLAKFEMPTSSSSDHPQTLPLTASHALIGTPLYMAPEQLEGRPADERSDIYALGLVMRELFRAGETPKLIQEVVNRCLERDPEERWQSVRDMRAALDLARTQPSTAPRKGRPDWLPWVIAGAAVAAMLAAVFWPRSAISPPPAVFSFTGPAKSRLDPHSGVPSPDGRRIAFIAIDESGKRGLWIRALGSTAPQRIEGTDGALGPFWSPDGQFIGFFADGKLKKIGLGGGPAQNLCNIVADLGASWSPSGEIVYSGLNRSELNRISAAGGTPRPVTELDARNAENSHRWPHFLPDGRHFLFTARSNVKENTAVYAGSLDSKETKRILTAQSNAQYAPPGYLLFAREGTLMAQRFDASRLELSGEPIVVAGGVEHVTPSASAMFSVSATGDVLSFQEPAHTINRFIWYDSLGSNLGTMGSGGQFFQPALSPDGKRLALQTPDPESGNRDIWLMDVATATMTRFTFNPANDWVPVWSPDGTQLAFASDRNGKSSIYRKTVGGGGEEELFVPASSFGGAFPDDWSADGRYLIYHTDGLKSLTDLWLMPLKGDRTPRPFVVTEFLEIQARFSPDTKWVAYVSNETGRDEVYMRPVEQPAKVRVSNGGGRFPLWRRDGKELFYIGLDGKLMAAAIRQGEMLAAGIPRALFQACNGAHTLRGVENFYDGDATGKRFLMVCIAPETEQRSITVMTHWTARLNTGVK